jgi:hypothetical protein
MFFFRSFGVFLKHPDKPTVTVVQLNVLFIQARSQEQIGALLCF